MIKKYEIIMDGSKKRIKALRSFCVQGRYVNLGDVGGIVYDENTLSQEGNCWIFSGNLNYPSIRVSGDSIVDTNGYEAAVTDPRPSVSITGTSALIGAHDFVTGSAAGGEPIEAYLDINDSRLEFQYTSAMTVATKVNLANTTLVGVYKSVIDTSNVIISKAGNGAFKANIFAEVIKCNVRFNAVTNNSLLIGNFSNVSEIINDGSYSFAAVNSAKNKINVRDCYTFVQAETILPTSAIGAAPANMPFIFIRCNVPNGAFYHNAKVKNIYTDIDFAKASADLGKIISGTTYKLVSSEVEGMYRIYDTTGNAYGYLVEAYDSVAGLTSMGANSYNTTIYKDAYIRGKFDFAGTNVFGNKVPGHPRAVELKAKPRVVQGTLNTVVVGEAVTGVAPSDTRVVTPLRYRINSGKGISVKNMPAGIRANIVVVNEHNVIEGASGTVTADTDFTTYAAYTYAFVIFSKTGDAAITPDELGDTTITVYNGCKLVNTGTTAVNMKGNIRVEDNATLVNADITGTGYFGGNSVVSYTPAVWAALTCYGTVHMKDNAVFAPTALTGACALVHMEGNAKFIGSVTVPITNLSFIMGNNAIIEGKANTRSGVVMSGNSRVAPTGIIAAASRGALVMKDNASIEANTIVIGAITLAGNYKGDVEKTWVGKRTITDVNEPEYDNNVKSKYDL
ncbi:hypothetical protein BC669P2_00029 [Bacteroides phage BC669P2]|nr:hypothetical protein BC669P2_00029 [Bacteroides phage BC669P2]